MNVSELYKNLRGRKPQSPQLLQQLQPGSGVETSRLRSGDPVRSCSHSRSAVIVAPTVGVKLRVKTGVERLLPCAPPPPSAAQVWTHTHTLRILNRLNFLSAYFKKDKDG